MLRRKTGHAFNEKIEFVVFPPILYRVMNNVDWQKVINFESKTTTENEPESRVHLN